MIDRYLILILKRPRLVIAILTAVTIFLALGIPKLHFNSSIDVMMPQKDTDYLAHERVKSVYGNIGKMILINVTSSTGTVWDPAFFRAFDAFITDLEKYRDSLGKGKIKRIISPLTASDLVGEQDTLEAVRLVPLDDDGKRIIPRNDAECRLLRDKLLRNPAFDHGIFSRDQRTGEITDFAVIIQLDNIRRDDPIAEAVWKLTRNRPGLTITPQGIPIVNKVMNDYMRHDLITFLPLVLLVMVIVFYLNFMTIRGVVFPFLTLVLTDIWILGLMGHWGVNLTLVGVSLPSLMVAVGSSYSIHILNQYYLDFGLIREKGAFEGLRGAVNHISVTVSLAGITTIFGFASLATNQITAIREWGIFSALGVLFAVFIAITIIPAGFMLLPHERPSLRVLRQQDQGVRTWLDPFIDWVARTVINHYRAVLAVLAVILVFCGIGIFRLEVDTSVLSYFKQDDYIRTSSLMIGKRYGGTFGMSIILDSGRDHGVEDPAFLRTVERVRAWLTAPENRDLKVERTEAFPDIIKTMHKAMHNDDPAMYRIPESRDTIVEYLEIYSGDDDNFDGRPDDFETYIDPRYRRALIFAKMWEGGSGGMGTVEMRHVRDKTAAWLGKTLRGGYGFQITGEPTIMIKLSDYVISGQLLSLLFSLLSVGLVVVILFRKITAGILALVPLTVAVIINFGIMGWAGIALDTATALIASITIGIGVDDTIHFLHTFRSYRADRLGIDETIVKVISVAGKAIIYTSLALVCGFSVLALSNFKPIILFGILIALTMVATTFGALMILPVTIKATGFSLAADEADKTIN